MQRRFELHRPGLLLRHAGAKGEGVADGENTDLRLPYYVERTLAQSVGVSLESHVAERAALDHAGIIRHQLIEPLGMRRYRAWKCVAVHRDEAGSWQQQPARCFGDD